MAAIIASKKKETTRQLEYILTFTSEDPDILEYLNGSHHKKYAKRWQKEHTDRNHNATIDGFDSPI